ncbi:DUF445 domain-containing protein [Comamonas sp. CMM03]|uniref:DUF445 domain-containing protein n=1 Tax=Comamonas TaxID=283 RepID=UPI001C4607BF|nr:MULTISPECIES: DUF445 domain-containing protein [Comamonas]MBV7420647.1 DUF445 domain-containing protein [Comamonas sp. CMM03]MDH1289871.1 DUF445 domain-containing protein [Comamonas terrigena]
MSSTASALQRAKRLALGLLLLVTAVFVATHFLPQTLLVRCLQSMAEAAMVGALADWFAVSALFRHIPIPWVQRHTAIIPRNKDRIGENLAVFVRDKFLDAPSLVALLRRHDAAQSLADWLGAPCNSQMLGRQLARLAQAGLEMVQDRQVERLLTQTLRSVLAQVDLSRSLATVLGALTQGGRHQAVLDDVLRRIGGVLQQADTHHFIAEAIVQWLKREHPLKEKMLPTDWLGDKGAELVAQALESLLDDIAHNPQHRMREAFDAAVQRLIVRLQNDPDYAARAEQVRHYLLHDEKLAAYLRDLWGGMRQRLEADLDNPKSHIARKLGGLGRWLGLSLAQDAALRRSMNERLERWAQALAPEVSEFIARHIRETVQRWDARELSALVEQHIGKDLQFIRINGTLVGGAIGLLLFAFSHLPELLRSMPR